MPIVHVPLTQGKVALIDEEDAERVLAFKWCAEFSGENSVSSRWYARHFFKNGQNIRLHRFVVNASPGTMVDHKNGDGLDCRRSNLRQCVKANNSQNCVLRVNNTSGFKGVTFDKRRNHWYARIKVDGKEIHFRSTNTAEESALIYDEAARIYYGEFARLNFPRNGERGVR